MNIPKSGRLAGLLMQWNGGQGSAVYAVAGRLAAGLDVPYAVPDVALAVEELDGQRAYRLDHVGRGDSRKIRADVEVLTELLGWLAGPTDSTVRFVSGAVHVFVDAFEPGRSTGRATGRIVVRDRGGELRFWPFTNLRTPPVDADESREFAAAAAIDVMSFDRTGARRNGVPVWAPPAAVCDAIHRRKHLDARGETFVRPARPGEEA